MCMHQQNVDLLSCLFCLLLKHPGESHFGPSSPQEDQHHRHLTRVNSEDEGALVKVVETMRTNYSDRYHEIYSY